MKSSCLLLLFFINMYQTRHVSTPGNGIRVPLTRTPITLEKLNSYMTTFQSNSVRPKDNTKIPLLKSPFGMVYYGNISIGSSTFRVQFDTGSSNLWVYSMYYYDKLCRSNGAVFKQHAQYKTENSCVCKCQGKPNCYKHLKYVFGLVKGCYSNDIVSMDGVRITNTQFLEVVQVTKNQLNQPYDGIMGLGYNPTKVSDNIVSKICRQIHKNQKRDITFSIYLTNSTTNTSGGELMFCGEDRSKYKDNIHYVNEIKNKTRSWDIEIQSVSLQSLNPVTSDKTQTASVDSGASLIFGPKRYIQNLNTAINASSCDYENIKKVNCDKIDELPILTFNINGKKYSLKGADYTIETSNIMGEQECVVGVAPLKDGGIDEWILGDVFLRKYYSVYDLTNHRIGFAESIHK